jgi:hypothetical protein
VSEAHEVGPLAEEAAKLLGEHLATGAAECTVCPLCRTVHAVRQLNPEVTNHLASAVSSLAQAAAALMATPTRRPADDVQVEHIQVDDEWPASD